VEVHGFFDDINVSGEPTEVMKAFDELQRLLPEIGLEFNTAKSQFAYFHEANAPLLRSIRAALAEHNIQVRTEWVEVVGAVVGKDEDAIRAGVAATLGTDKGTAAFFERLQLDVLKVQSSMLILRQCGVPKMNYALRCIPPPCIAQQAIAFDEQVIGVAKSKLLLHEDEAERRPTTERLRAPLRHGGFGLTSALATSPAAYLGSMAAVSAAPTFAPYSEPDSLLPRASLLHGWIESSMDVITDESPECSELLPPSATTFFQHFHPRSSSAPKAPSLQHQLSSQARDSVFMASLQQAKEMQKRDGGVALAHLKSVSAPRAWTWKVVLPTSKELELSDTEYRIAARLNLGLQPMAGAAVMPDICPLCTTSKRTSNSIRADPWHFLSCTKVRKGEATARHDDVGRAIYRCALLMGFRAQLEPTGLDPSSDLRPDVLLTLPGRQILTDVAICHPLAPGTVRAKQSTRTLGRARNMEALKKRKYSQLSSLRHYEMLPFIIETCGGMGPSADALVKAMAEASEEHLAVWSKEDVIRELIGTVAIAVQRGGAMTYLEGYERTLRTMTSASRVAARVGVRMEDESEEGRESESEEEEKKEDELFEDEEGNVTAAAA
jgi:hypothetical protein